MDFIVGDNLELESFLKQNVNALKEQNVPQRRNASNNLLLKVSDPNIAQSDVLSQQILMKFGKDLLKGVSDVTEKVRENCIQCLTLLVENSTESEELLPYLLAVLVEQSNCTDLEGIQHLPEVMRPPPSQIPRVLIKFVEQSEEVRLLLVNLLHAIISNNTGDTLHDYVDDIVDILRAFLMDPYGEIQKAACRSLSKFCRDNHQMLLHFVDKMSRSLLYPLISKKSPIRIAALDALSSILICGVWKQNAFVFEVLTGFKDPNSVPIKAFYEPTHNINYLATLIIDPKAQVRQHFIKQIGFWLIDLADRWDHHARLVPYLLSGLFDVDEQTREASLSIIDQVGLQWEAEREKDIKDIKQLGIEPKWTKNGCKSILPLPTPFKSRPKLGARGFIKGQVRKMWPALYKEIVDLNEENRVRASQLILMGVIYSEDYMTQFLDAFIVNTIPGLKDSTISQTLCSVYHLIGRFCEPSSYSLIIFSSLRGKYVRDEVYMRNAIIALHHLLLGAIEVEGVQVQDLKTQIISLMREDQFLEYISLTNYEPINELQKLCGGCPIVEGVVNYIANFGKLLLGTQLQQQLPLTKAKLQTEITDEIRFGSWRWKVLISQFITFGTGIETIENINCELPESIDFLQKLSVCMIRECQVKESLQLIIRLFAKTAQWQMTYPNLKQVFLTNISLMTKELRGLRNYAKLLQKDQLTIQFYCIGLVNVIKQAPVYNDKDKLVQIISDLANLFLPYPSERLFTNNLLPTITQYVFDVVDTLGETPSIITKKSIFELLNIVHQYIPIKDEFYLGDIHVIPDYQSHIKKLLKYSIDVLLMQSRKKIMRRNSNIIRF